MGAISINAAEVHGEKYTGYEGPDKGPFECGNCTYFEDGTCGQKTMIAKSSLPKVDGRVKVDRRGCCEYVNRKGRKLYGKS